MINPVTQRPWGRADIAILQAASYMSADWATATQWARAGETIGAGQAPTLVAFTRGDAQADPAARLYLVYNREQLASHQAAIEADRDAEAEARHGAAAEATSGAPRLTTFLIRNGGLRPHGELSAMDARIARPGLINRRGLSLDRAAEAALQAGYIEACAEGNGCDSNLLLDALSEDLRGRPVYPWMQGQGAMDCPF